MGEHHPRISAILCLGLFIKTLLIRIFFPMKVPSQDFEEFYTMETI